MSETQIATYWPGDHPGILRRIVAVEMGVGGLDGELAAVGHGVARVDREVEDRVFELVGIGLDPPQAGGEHGLDLDRLAERAVEQFRHAGDQLVDVDRACGSSGWRREKASRRWVSVAARSAPTRALPSARTIRGSPASPTWRRAASTLPVMTVSRLLKSWAMPPVSWPTASIFCDWRSASSACSRSAIAAATRCLQRLVQLAQRLLGAPSLGDLALRRLVEPGIVDRDRRLAGDADQQLLVALR